MAIYQTYQRLLFEAGGGIVLPSQQAEQRPNTASVLIGLGGTGINCLRTIKTEVHSCIKPDEPRATTPTYDHIRFLGVDNDQRGHGAVGQRDYEYFDGLLTLDETEYFSIANPDLDKMLDDSNAMSRPEFNWIRDPRELVPYRLGGDPLGRRGSTYAIRQRGRVLLMDKSASFYDRIEQEIRAARSGRSVVNVHILSGLAGGTGSGIFLDVCYMVRSIAKELGPMTIFGYFFLPDVNLSHIPCSNRDILAYILRNGYATLQELDYCMRLGENGDAFTQDYQGRKIDWNCAPVDLCHLISATDANDNVAPNAYEHAMDATTQYVMDSLVLGGGNIHERFPSSYPQTVRAADSNKLYGYNLAYCTIGAAYASLPLREANTYLISELFAKFASISRRTPTQEDVERISVLSLSLAGAASGVGELYDSIAAEIRSGFDLTYLDYPDDYRAALDNGTVSMLEHYGSQTAHKIASAEKNAGRLQDEGCGSSLIDRVRAALVDVIRDHERGPVFAHHMLSTSNVHNMLNVVEGLIVENRIRWEWAQHETGRVRKLLQDAQRDFGQRRNRSFLDNDRKRFEDLKAAIVAEESNKLDCRCHEMMDEVLHRLKAQIEDADAHYYARLARVVSTLVETSEENRHALDSHLQATRRNHFGQSLLTSHELRRSMNAELERVDVSDMFSAFMGSLLKHDEEWLQEDEDRIARFVTWFFAETAFCEFANLSFTSFLKDKYRVEGDVALTDRIYPDWIERLAARSKPLFHFNDALWRENQTSQFGVISVPETSVPTHKAAEIMQRNDESYGVVLNTLTDRIYVITVAAALPISAYSNCRLYEDSYYMWTYRTGMHSYESDSVPGMTFGDWRKLPPLTPQSFESAHMADVPQPMSELFQTGRDLFERAEGAGLFDYERYILRPSAESLERLRAVAEDCERRAAQLQSSDQVAEAERTLEAARELEMMRTDAHFPMDGPNDPKVRRRILQDHFVSAPVRQLLVREILAEMDEPLAAADAAESALKARAEDFATERDLNDYIDALLTGVISLEGNVVSFHRDESDDDVTLSQFGPEFPYSMIPPYQGFVGYRALGDDDKEHIRADAAILRYLEPPQVATTRARLKDMLADDRIEVWCQISRRYPNGSDIVEMLVTLRDRFAAFCQDGLSENPRS